MADNTRVALLARAGEVRDRMREALLRSGAELVLVGDPAELDNNALRGAAPQALLVALDDEVVDSLDALDAVLSDPALQVIYEESELAMRRQGWDEARWVRHLRAKLAGSDDVLPPGTESAPAVAPTRVLHGADAVESEMDFASFAAEAAHLAAVVPAQGEAVKAAPAATAEANTDHPATSAATDAATDASDDTLASPPLRVGAAAAAGVEAETDVAASATAQATDAGNDDPHAFDPTALDYDLPTPAAATRVENDLVDFDRMFAPPPELPADTAAAVPAHAAPAMPAAAPVAGSAPAASTPPRAGLELSLADDTPAAPRKQDSAEDAQFKQALDGLSQRVAHLELLDDHAAIAGDQGCVVVFAGVGGPDAVRQLLAALPQDFARAVLVAQHLDAGRYDKLVTQMSRATAMPVMLAQPGSAPQAGRVYMLAADTGLGRAPRAFSGSMRQADFVAALPASDSALVFLSGADPALVDAAMNVRAQGALVLAQAEEGCFDARAAQALAQRGVQAALPAALAGLLVKRWRDGAVL